MKLHWSPKSPYVRKVMIAAHELGLVSSIEKVRSVAAMKAPNPAIMADNPLSKIPTLVLDTGEAIFGSQTICEYLDAQAGGEKLFPRRSERSDGPRSRGKRWAMDCWIFLFSGATSARSLTTAKRRSGSRHSQQKPMRQSIGSSRSPAN